jgi:hypothetical protein
MSSPPFSPGTAANAGLAGACPWTLVGFPATSQPTATAAVTPVNRAVVIRIGVLSVNLFS